MGNGNEASGDGWRYRGRGVFQLTGKNNYQACGTALNIDFINSPELLEQPVNAFRSAGWYWTSKNLNSLADNGDFITITKKINGGTNGLDARLKYWAAAKSTLSIV
jgi:putative chitinase